MKTRRTWTKSAARKTSKMANTSVSLSRCGEIAREKDPDRFLVSMLAPADRRESLFALIAFNHEVAKTKDAVSEPMLGQIRLQWWREAIEECYDSQPRRHEVVQPLHQAIEQHALPKNRFIDIIDTRENDLEQAPFGTEDELLEYAEATGGGLAELSVSVLGGHNDATLQAARNIGTAWALTGLMRALPFHLRSQWVSLPASLQNKQSITAAELRKCEGNTQISAAVRDICDLAVQQLRTARARRHECSKSAKPVLYLAGLCDGYLRQLRNADYDPFSPKLANKPAMRVLGLMARNLTGRF